MICESILFRILCHLQVLRWLTGREPSLGDVRAYAVTRDNIYEEIVGNTSVGLSIIDGLLNGDKYLNLLQHNEYQHLGNWNIRLGNIQKIVHSYT